MAREARPGSRWKSAASWGSTDCGAYRRAKDEMPAAATPTVTRGAITTPKKLSKANKYV
jgi:hypothetical protein